MKTAINRPQLNLEKSVELEEEPFLDVIVKPTNGEVLSVLELSYSLRILECRRFAGCESLADSLKYAQARVL